MNSTIVLFLDDVNKVNEIVASGIVINEAYTAVMPLMQPAKKILVSNVPPYIKDEVIERELARHGKVVSKIKKIALNCKSVQLKHVVTFRRQVYMILNNGQELNLALKFRVNPISLSYPFPLVLRVHVRVRAIPILVLIEG